MNENTLIAFLAFLGRLKAANIHYSLSDPTDGAVMVEIAVPGERWEVEFHEDGRVSVEIFRSDAGVQEGEMIEQLFDRFSN